MCAWDKLNLSLSYLTSVASPLLAIKSWCLVLVSGWISQQSLMKWDATCYRLDLKRAKSNQVDTSSHWFPKWKTTGGPLFFRRLSSKAQRECKVHSQGCSRAASPYMCPFSVSTSDAACGPFVLCLCLFVVLWSSFSCLHQCMNLSLSVYHTLIPGKHCLLRLASFVTIATLVFI